MTNKTKIHFVCNGNIYRSRLAAAYLKSIAPELEVSSSGLHTERHPRISISDLAKDISRRHNLVDYIGGEKTQTSNDILKNQDIIVFMRGDVYDDAKQNYDFNDNKSLIWDIKDRENWPPYINNSRKKLLTFKAIKKQVDRLLYDVRNGNWVEVFNEDNNPANCRLPINIANRKDKGCWHRGCHAIITTPNNHVLIQKRSSRMIFAPSMIDVSMGGMVDAGESPEEAMVREIKEEIGIQITKNDLQFIEIYKHSGYHPHYHKLSRSFVYAYHITLSVDHPNLVRQDTEVSELHWLSPKRAKLLVKAHHLKHLGKLNYTYNFYKKLLSSIE